MSERTDPLRTIYREAEAAFTTFPPPDSVFAEADGAVDTVSGFGDPEAERRAVREGGALVDFAWKRVIRITGDERLEFLNRMLTQELKGLKAERAVSSFWLNRKGRIVADLRALHFERETLLEVDAPALSTTLESLQSFVIIEDVELANDWSRWRTFVLTGPDSHAWVQAASGGAAADLQPGAVVRTSIAGIEMLVDRDDGLGPNGLRLLIPANRVVEAHHHLLEVGAKLEVGGPQERRMVGWEAYNACRIERGLPVFLVDFGTSSLPHESGLLSSRVSFTKGCFLGQEVVARMHSLGQPKQKCVRLRIDATELPGPGAKLYPAGPTETDPVGVVTSAAALDDAHAVAAMAQIKTRFAVKGESLQLHDGAIAEVLDIPGF